MRISQTVRKRKGVASTIKTAVQKGDYATPEKNVPKFVAPTTTQGVARSGYAKKLRTQEVRGKSQISYKKPNTTTLSTPAMSSGYTQKVASKAYLNTARNGGEEGKENSQNRTGRIARSNTYTSFVKSRTGKSPRLSGKGKRITSANKALLDRYNRGK